MSDLKPCPFCGETPDINSPLTFQDSQGTKWGAVQCCCEGPEVRTGYQSVEHWRDDAIEAWNKRASPWIPVEERLPEAFVDVLVRREGPVRPFCDVLCWIEAAGQWTDGQSNLVSPDDVLCWMPLPEGPA